MKTFKKYRVQINCNQLNEDILSLKFVCPLICSYIDHKKYV
jgi:hypothetical protein